MNNATAAHQLNYDPTDPDKMRLPAGTTCGDCVHIYRCKTMFGHTETDTYCDWSPSRFRAAAKETAASTAATPTNAVQAEGIRHQMPMVRVACISLDGITLTVPATDLQQHIEGLDDSKADHEGDDSPTYHLTFKTMLVRDYEALGEFDGF